jgi:hypothetical protein
MHLKLEQNINGLIQADAVSKWSFENFKDKIVSVGLVLFLLNTFNLVWLSV